MIEVFSTSLTAEADTRLVIEAICKAMPGARVDFDLDDRERIMRVHGPYIQANEVILILAACGFTADVLPDAG